MNCEHGWGYKGGIARAALVGRGFIRDIDLWMTTGRPTVPIADVELAWSIDHLLTDRDVSINEAVVCGECGLLITSERARVDADNRVVRVVQQTPRAALRGARFAAAYGWDLVVDPTLLEQADAWDVAIQVVRCTESDVSVHAFLRLIGREDFLSSVLDCEDVPEWTRGTLKAWSESAHVPLSVWLWGNLSTGRWDHLEDLYA